MRIKTIGLLYETIEDARNLGYPLEFLHHWREPQELLRIESAIQQAGFKTLRIGMPQDLIRNLSNLKGVVDFIFSLSVGFQTRFRQAYGAMACELAEIPYTGADPFAKIVGQNKHVAKSFFEKLEIFTPPWSYVHDVSAKYYASFPDFPLIVKPACEGTSVGITNSSVVYDRENLMSQIDYILTNLKLPVIVEKFIIGREFKICIIGNNKILFEGIIEDVHHDGSPLKADFLHYVNKKDVVFKKIKHDIYDPEFALIRKWCHTLYRFLSPLDYAVFDVRQDEEGNFYILECNTDATLHPERTLAECCRLHGVFYESMIELILKSAFERWGISWK